MYIYDDLPKFCRLVNTFIPRNVESSVSWKERDLNKGKAFADFGHNVALNGASNSWVPVKQPTFASCCKQTWRARLYLQWADAPASANPRELCQAYLSHPFLSFFLTLTHTFNPPSPPLSSFIPLFFSIKLLFVFSIAIHTKRSVEHEFRQMFSRPLSLSPSLSFSIYIYKQCYECTFRPWIAEGLQGHFLNFLLLLTFQSLSFTTKTKRKRRCAPVL